MKPSTIGPGAIGPGAIGPGAIEAGASGRIEHLVRPEDLADRWRGEVRSCASPLLVWLAELACMEAIRPGLPPGWTSVGAGFDLKHLAPTPAGLRIVVTARLVRTAGTSLLFSVTGEDGIDEVLRGTHLRVARERAEAEADIAAKAERAAAR